MAALWKPPVALSGVLCQGKGQYARLRKRSISTSTSEEQVLSMLPSARVTICRFSPGITSARGSLRMPAATQLLEKPLIAEFQCCVSVLQEGPCPLERPAQACEPQPPGASEIGSRPPQWVPALRHCSRVKAWRHIWHMGATRRKKQD